MQTTPKMHAYDVQVSRSATESIGSATVLAADAKGAASIAIEKVRKEQGLAASVQLFTEVNEVKPTVGATVALTNDAA